LRHRDAWYCGWFTPVDFREKKTLSLFGALSKLKETFGSCTLEPARTWPDEKQAFLCSLPEISRKSALLRP